MCIIPFLGWGLENKKRSRRQAHRGFGLVAKQLHSIWESPDSTPAPHTRGKTKQNKEYQEPASLCPSPPFLLLNAFHTLGFSSFSSPTQVSCKPGLWRALLDVDLHSGHFWKEQSLLTVPFLELEFRRLFSFQP